ncbi:MAG: F0F1 ATP synthase subunit epsilon [Chloroflexi bacterium]|nr:F0F1 ATP synthase subunit epsilon [Chloroflexota bacterium]
MFRVPRREGCGAVPLKVDVVTAERVVYSEEGVDRLIVPGVEGELGVLPLHAPLLTMIEPGVMRIVKGSDEVEMAITGGFIEVRENRVTILADAAERAEEIDTERAEASRRRAQERLAAKEIPQEDLIRAEVALRRALVRLKLAERRRRRGGPPGLPGP